MAWGKCVIISLGLMLITHVAQARDIDTFTDSQGTLHITNLGSKKPTSPVNPPNPAASLQPGNLPGKAPVTPPVRAPAPEVQAPAPEPGPAPAVPIPVAPQRGSRVTHTEGPRGVMRRPAGPGGRTSRESAAGATRASLQRVSWTPPQPVKAVANGKIVIHRDRQGVIHITNVPLEVAPGRAADPGSGGSEQALPPGGALPTVQQVSCPVPALARKHVWPPGPAPPAVQQVSCPELGPEVADYLEAKLLAHAPALTGQTIQRYQDHRGVWHIGNEPAPDPPLPQAQVSGINRADNGAGVSPGPAGDPNCLRPGVGAGVGQAAARRRGPESGRPARPSRCLAYFHPRFRGGHVGSG